MQDYQLYEQILGLSHPWQVERVELKVPNGEIEVRVACVERVWACPKCQCRMHLQDWDERRWRHLDSCQFKTWIVAAVPRVVCAEHGSVTVQVPWAEPYGRFTKLFERLAIDVLRACSISAAGDLLRISWDEADGIKQRAVRRGVERKPERPVKRLGVDEKSAGRGQNYVTVVACLDPGQTATVESVTDGRKQEALDAYWQSLSPATLAGVEAVAMDLWQPYFQSTLTYVPDAAGKIVASSGKCGGCLTGWDRGQGRRDERGCQS